MSVKRRGERAPSTFRVARRRARARSCATRSMLAPSGRAVHPTHDPRANASDLSGRVRSIAVSRSIPRPSISIAGLRPAIASASTRAEPQASAQPLTPWPRLSQMPSVPLGPAPAARRAASAARLSSAAPALRCARRGTSRRAPCRAWPARRSFWRSARRRSRRCRRRGRAGQGG